MNLITPAERAWLFTLAVTLAVIGWGGLAYWLIMASCCQYRPWLFAAFWGAIMGEVVAVLLLLLERKRSLDDLDRQALRTEEARNKFPWMYQGDLTPINRTYAVQVQGVKGSSVYIADLTRAHGGEVVTANLAAERFWSHVSAGKPITNRECEPICGGRVNYNRMRQALLNAGVIERVGKVYRYALPR